MTLLKGLTLYRAILRQHRRTLPPHLRQLGDQYVKAEFRLHRGAKADVLASFQEEWNVYLDMLKAPAAKLGAHLAEAEVQRLAPHQHEQLHKLKEEAVKAARAQDEAEGAEAAAAKGNGGGRDSSFPSKLG